MTAAFIIAEYNPFHNGHEYHINMTKELLRPDAVVCVMSGHFTQRGSATVTDKWSRARMALRAGADLVVELHPVYACSSAEYFARGALLTASALGMGGWLSFGAENTNLDVISDIADILNNEPEQYKELLAVSLDGGAPFAAARQRALTGYYFDPHGGAADAASSRARVSSREFAAILRGPNNILAIEYVRAIKSLSLPLTPFAVPRVSARANTVRPYEGGVVSHDAVPRVSAHHKQEPFLINKNYSTILSATDIRDRLYAAQDDTDYIGAMPDYARALLASEFSIGRGPVFDGAFFPLISAIVKRGAPEDLSGYRDVGEGLENRLYKTALRAGSYAELIDGAASKRYPKSRIRRILTAIMLGYDINTLLSLDPDSGPPYLRVLGFTAKGRQLLSHIEPEVPVITNYKKLINASSRQREFMKLEARATDIYVTAFQNRGFNMAGQDFLRGPARI